MLFGRKLKRLRKSAKITQGELAEKLNVTSRTLINYETGRCYPKQTEIYSALASIFDVTVDYLMSEDDEFTLTTYKLGKTPQMQAQSLVNELTALLNGGILAEDDKDAMMKAISSSYWEAKEISKNYDYKNGIQK
ncbi:MAG: helix-turn-helix transcriptional regulator [Proteocatella sp.]